MNYGKDFAKPAKVKRRTPNDSSKLCSCELWKNIIQAELLQMEGKREILKDIKLERDKLTGSL